MNSANKFKKIYLLIFAFLMMGIAAKATPTAYAVYSEGTLTFSYGEMPNVDNVYDVSNTLGMPGWYSFHEYIRTVVFESSFSEARPKSCQLWFYQMMSLTTIQGLSNLNTSEVTSMNNMFCGCSSLTSLDLRNFNTSKVKYMGLMFSGCSRLSSLDLSSFNTGNVKEMSHMFDGCSALTSLDLSNFNTEKVEQMSYMFHKCYNLISLKLDNFNTSNVIEMGHMFDSCGKLPSLDLGSFDTSSAINMNEMFRSCYELTSLDISGFNTSNAQNMYAMFYNCYKLSSLDLSGFNTSNVTDMSVMFCACYELTSLDVSGFNTSKVTNMKSMFDNCKRITNLDVRSFDTSNVQDMDWMFNNCYNLITIYCNDSWNCSSSYNMFYKCDKLVGKIQYDESKIDGVYANPETGYFTCKVDTYDVTINAKPITSLNCKDLTAIPGVTGTAIYDDATHTLTLKDASISSTSGECGIYCDNTIDTLYINIEGECNISCPDNTGINALAKCVKIQGGGILNIIGYDGIYMEKSTSNRLWVTDGTQVYVDGARYGVRGREYTQRVVSGGTKTYRYTALQVDGEKTLLSVKGATMCYKTLGSFTLSEGYKVTAPSNTTFYTTDLNGTEQYTFCKRTLTIEKGSATTLLTFTPVADTWVTIEDTRSYNIPGDVNGDGSITMADANAVVNYFLSTDKSGITNFDVTAADVNKDGGITMADANQIVNMFLGIGNDSHETETPDTKQAIDLGLSVKWATCNVGASEPWDYGDYFAWGETAGYAAGTTHVFDWSSYKYRTNSFITKYVFSWVDNTVYNDYPVLLPEDDAAVVNWGGTWRMPTEEELKDLWTKCQWTWQPAGNTKYNGVAGYEVTGTNGNSIFIPHAGYYDGEKKDNWTILWSSTLYPANDETAWILWFSSGTTSCSNYADRYLGVSVRPVCP